MLARLTPSSVICLVRRTPVNNPDVETIFGDVSLPYFGLSRERIRDIGGRIDCIVHAAAVTDFSKSDELVLRTNVSAVEHILELASTARVPLYHLSTAFVRAPARPEGAPKEPTYAISKREGERMVKGSGVPYSIIRPSIIIGESATGVIARFQGVHGVAGSILKGVLPMMPASPESYLDFVPQDVVAEAVIAIANEGRVGEDYWITAGPSALTVRRVIELIVEFSRSVGRPVSFPKFIAPDFVERLLRPVFMPAMPPSLQKGLERVIQISSYLSIDEPFPTSLPALQERLGLPRLPDLEAAFVRGLAYWAEKTGFARRASSYAD
jgi:nucleoside-diphosphate-sugar epimerase